MIRRLIACAAVAALAAACQPADTTEAPPATETASADGAVASYAAAIDSGWPAGQAVTPAEVTAMIEADGAQATVNALADNFAEPNRWQTVIRGIARGEQPWLDVSNAISTGTDAGTADEYMIAMSDALTQNAPGVLRIASADGGDVTGVCQENGFETAQADADAFFNAAIEAVEAVDDPGLTAARDACLTSLRAGQAGFIAPPAG